MAQRITSPSLTRADRDRLARFGIDADLIAAAGVRRVTDREARDHGISGPAGTLEGVLYPHLSARGQPVAYRVRRDVVLEGQPKYVQSQDRAAWAFPPDAAGRCADPAVPAVMVEAHTSMLVLEALARRTGRPLLPIATAGAFNWQGRIGKRVAADGASADERGPLRDFQDLVWSGREVILLFDSNTDDPADPAKRKRLTANRAKLAAHLAQLGATVRLGIVPPGVNGPDDYFAAHGDAAVWQLLEDAGAWSPPQAAGDDRGGRGPSQATRLVALAVEAGAMFFTSPDGDRFMSIPIDGHLETYQVPSRAARAWLTRAYFGATGAAPTATALADALGVVGARAEFDGHCHPVFVRVGQAGRALYLDLGDPTWRAVEITANGWRVIDVPPVRFRRPKGQRPLPLPDRGDGLSLLRALVNVAGDDDFRLVVSFLVAAVRPVGPYPVLSLTGEQGSAKSTTARVLKHLVDPGAAPLRAEPKEPRDLMIGASNTHVLAFDNISHLPAWLSDALCRLATGGGFATRTLFSDTDETIIDVQRPVILTGIDDYITRGDLLDRALVVNLPRLRDEDRLTEAAYHAAVEQAHPVILAALLDGAAHALRTAGDVALPTLPRMADFALWSAAAAPACGWSAEDFLASYTRARQDSITATLDTDPFAQAVLALPRPWAGTASDLLATLTAARDPATHPKAWPGSPRALSSTMHRLAPLFRRLGLSVVERQ